MYFPVGFWVLAAFRVCPAILSGCSFTAAAFRFRPKLWWTNHSSLFGVRIGEQLFPILLAMFALAVSAGAAERPGDSPVVVSIQEHRKNPANY